MRNKRILSVMMAMVMVCSSATVLEAKSGKGKKVNLSEAVQVSEKNADKHNKKKHQIVKPEISFVNEDADSFASADISEEEARQARLEREMDAQELGYDADSIIVVYEKNSEDSVLEESADIEEVCKEQVTNSGDKGAEELIGTEECKVVTVELNDNKTVESAIADYQNLEGVICAEPNYIMHPDGQEKGSKKTEIDMDEMPSLEVEPDTIEPASVNVNDSGSVNQWYLDNINVTEAWNLVSGSPHSRVKVCILDTGCTLNHADLGVNTVESRELVRLSSGQFTTWPLKGERYYKGVRETVSRNSDGHGTSVTGIIGAIAGNSYGMAGVASCYNNDVVDMVVVDVDEEGVFYTETIIRALQYANEIKAKVVNMSLSGKGYSKAWENVCDMLYNNGVVLVGSAGNSNGDEYREPSDFGSVISVISTDRNNNKASDSSYGYNKDICAPGVGLYTTADRTVEGYDFKNFYGTSAAAPVVTGVVAMMLSVNPNLTPAQVKSILCQTATDLGAAGKDNIYANGLVNAGAAVRKSMVKATGVYPIYQENSIVLGCVHEGGIQQTKYRWEYCNMNNPSSSWQLISDWNTSEWCTWYPDANETYAVVCKASYFGNGVADSQTVWYVSRPQMTAKLTGTCVTPSGNGILLGCTANTDKYYTAVYIYSYITNSWIVQACSCGAACWYQANGLPKGMYMAYFCTEDSPYGRKLSTSYYNFTVN